jgi:hypothetical protein
MPSWLSRTVVLVHGKNAAVSDGDGDDSITPMLSYELHFPPGTPTLLCPYGSGSRAALTSSVAMMSSLARCVVTPFVIVLVTPLVGITVDPYRALVVASHPDTFELSIFPHQLSSQCLVCWGWLWSCPRPCSPQCLACWGWLWSCPHPCSPQCLACWGCSV